MVATTRSQSLFKAECPSSPLYPTRSQAAVEEALPSSAVFRKGSDSAKPVLLHDSTHQHPIVVSRPYRRCAGCSQQTRADVWCCECSRCLCTSCDERRHGTDALDSLRRPMCSHRVEHIVDGGGVPLLSSLLEITVILSAILTVRPLLSAAGTMLNTEYFFESVCPLVRRFRLLVFRMDHALYPLVRGTLGAWCDTEDAFIKIFVDVWVRGILTSTDSFALLCMKIPMTLGALIVVLAITPLLAIPYATIATAVRLVELLLVPNCTPTRILARTARWINVLLWLPLKLAGWFARSTALGLIMDNEYRQHFHRRLKIPPKTGHRLRPTRSHGVQDASPMGAMSRVTRIFVYFHRKARRTIVGTILTAVLVAVVVRVVLLSLARCGTGILSVHHDHHHHDESPSMDDKSSSSACSSVHAWIRSFAQASGVELPDFEELGDQGRVLAQLQDSTEDDYMDQVLRLTVRALYSHLISYPLWMRVVLSVGLVAFGSAGVLRRVLYWIDLRWRHGYSAMWKARKQAADEANKGSDEAEAPEDGKAGNEATQRVLQARKLEAWAATEANSNTEDREHAALGTP